MTRESTGGIYNVFAPFVALAVAGLFIYGIVRGCEDSRVQYGAVSLTSLKEEWVGSARDSGKDGLSDRVNDLLLSKI